MGFQWKDDIDDITGELLRTFSLINIDKSNIQVYVEIDDFYTISIEYSGKNVKVDFSIKAKDFYDTKLLAESIVCELVEMDGNYSNTTINYEPDMPGDVHDA
jgi:hypothetical protein